MRRLILLCALLLMPLGAALAQDTVDIGPWTLGDTRAQVVAEEDLGPYDAIAGRGLQTSKLEFLDAPAVVRFEFDGEDRLRSLQVELYAGPDYAQARAAALRVFELFDDDFGGAAIPGIEIRGTDVLDRAGLEAVLDKMLGEAPVLAEQFKAQRLAATTTLDLVPLRYTAANKSVAQLSYSSRDGHYAVRLYQDPANAPDRRVQSFVQVQAL